MRLPPVLWRFCASWHHRQFELRRLGGGRRVVGADDGHIDGICRNRPVGAVLVRNRADRFSAVIASKVVVKHVINGIEQVSGCHDVGGFAPRREARHGLQQIQQPGRSVAQSVEVAAKLA